MAKALREPSVLEQALEELSGLRDQLDRTQRNKALWTEELRLLWEERTTSGSTPENQKRSVELRSWITDEDEQGEVLRVRILERQQQVATLTKDTRKNEAATAVRTAENEWSQLMQIDTSGLERWLKKATDAHRLWVAAYKEQSPFIRASSNSRFEEMRREGQEFWNLARRLRSL